MINGIKKVGYSAMVAVLMAGSSVVAASPASAGAGQLDEGIAVVAQEVIQQSEADDPQAFEARVDKVLETDAFEGLPDEASQGDRTADAEVLAAVVDDELALIGMMEMLASGAIASVVGADGAIQWEIDEERVQQGVGSAEEAPLAVDMAAMSMPQCPAAWAAALSWITVNAGKCAIFGPKAAIACAIAYGIAGEIIDFNRAC